MLIEIITKDKNVAYHAAQKLSGGKALIWLILKIPGRPEYRRYMFSCGKRHDGDHVKLEL